MTRQYFNLWYRLDRNDRYLIWYTDERDGVVVDSSACVPTFEDADALLTFAQTHGFSVEPKEGVPFDLDAVVRWLEHPNTLSIDCCNALNAWNLFGDVAHSVSAVFEVDRKSTENLYEKLFWGNNLAPVTPPGAHYVPEWTVHERRILADTLSSGLALFRKVVRPA